MAMNKKEQTQLQKFMDEAVINRALRWSDYEILPDVPPPTGSGYVNGWSYNSHSLRVYKSWSGSVTHGDGHAETDVRPSSGSQRGISQYSTSTLALKAMRRDMENRFARRLADVDQMIKATEEEGQ